jgi:hypothetical protein
MVGVGVTEEVRAPQHPLDRAASGPVQRNHPAARLILAVADVENPLGVGIRIPDLLEVDVPAPHMLDLDASHRRVGGEDAGAVSSVFNARPIAAPCDSDSIFT